MECNQLSLGRENERGGLLQNCRFSMKESEREDMQSNRQRTERQYLPMLMQPHSLFNNVISCIHRA